MDIYAELTMVFHSLYYDGFEGEIPLKEFANKLHDAVDYWIEDENEAQNKDGK